MAYGLSDGRVTDDVTSVRLAILATAWLLVLLVLHCKMTILYCSHSIAFVYTN